MNRQCRSHPFAPLSRKKPVAPRRSGTILLAPLLLCLLVTSFAAPRAADRPSGGGWVVEWDLASGWAEREALAPGVSSIRVFGASFNASDQPYIPDTLRAWLAAGGEGRNLTLTVVNDAVREGSASILKDPDLVSRLLATPESRQRHRDDLLKLARSGPFTGLDIDYERVKREDWPAFLEFCRSLSEKMAAAGLRLRVLLEPKRQYFELPLPSGPEYMIMAYNLFGGHSGPGPKANPAFIARLAAQCRGAGATARLAIATGGFAWRDNGTVKGITELEAVALAKNADALPRRDPDSRYVTFRYTADDGVKGEVWYADGVTLAHLVDAARRHGFTDFDIWRLGGNAPASLAKIAGALAPTVGRTIRVAPAPAAPETGADAAFPTIAAAIREAKKGDRIVVAPGTYRENLSVETPGLVISSPPGSETSAPVRIVGEGGMPTLIDAADTVWRGIAFAHSGDDDVVVLDGFEGRFEHCRFDAEGTAAPRLAVRVNDGDPTFHASVFSGVGGDGIGLAASALPDRPGSVADFTYCRIEGFAANAAVISGDIDVRFANCLLTRNGRLLYRHPAYRGGVELVNCTLFLNHRPEITSLAPEAPPVLVAHSLYMPVFNDRLWVMGVAPERQREVRVEKSRALSPRFMDVGRRIAVNLGIDDTANVGVWEALAKQADEFGFKVTLAVNTAVTTPDDWEVIRKQVANGHEAGSHTASHTMLQLATPISVGFRRPGIARATLLIDASRRLTVQADAKVIFSQSLDEAPLTINALGRALAAVGVASKISPYHGNVPARFLAETAEVDISFPHPVVPLPLDGAAFLEYELSTSRDALAENVPQQTEIAFINPFSVSSPMAKDAIASHYYVASRTSVEFWGDAADDDQQGRGVLNLFGLPAYPLQDARNMVKGNPVIENVRMLLDHAKSHFLVLSLYSHGEGEFSLGEWHELLELLKADGKIEVLTLLDIAHRLKTEGKDLGGGIYTMPLPEAAHDYRPAPDSPLLRAGKPLGIATDFAGNPVPAGAPPNIGLYQ